MGVGGGGGEEGTWEVGEGGRAGRRREGVGEGETREGAEGGEVGTWEGGEEGC